MFPDTGLFPNDSHMVGDAAYPLLTQLIVPYRDTGRLTHRQRKFNHALSQSQCVIEHACALLKGRFKRLKYLDMVRVDLVPRVIMACCVLHNLCIGQHDYLDDEDVEGPGDDGQQEVGCSMLAPFCWIPHLQRYIKLLGNTANLWKTWSHNRQSTGWTGKSLRHLYFEK